MTWNNFPQLGTFPQLDMCFIISYLHDVLLGQPQVSPRGLFGSFSQSERSNNRRECAEAWVMKGSEVVVVELEAAVMGFIYWEEDRDWTVMPFSLLWSLFHKKKTFLLNFPNHMGFAHSLFFSCFHSMSLPQYKYSKPPAMLGLGNEGANQYAK